MVFSIGPISDKNAPGGPVTLYGWSGGLQDHFQNPASDATLIDGNHFEAVTDADAHSGSQSWYVKGLLYGNPGQGSPHTPSTGAALVGPGTTWRASFWFKLVDPVLDPNGSKLNVYTGVTGGTDRTGAHVQIQNGSATEPNGFSIVSFGWNGSYQKVTLAANLDRNLWHHVSWTHVIEADPNTGSCVYSIDGGPEVSVHPPWPNAWRASQGFAPAYGDNLAIGGGLGTSGFYMDDIEYSVTNTSTGVASTVTIDFEGPPTATGAPFSSYVSSSVAKRELLLEN